MPISIDDILKKYWGYDSFRPMQREIIEGVIAGRDTLALLPTGGGKSLTYQVPAMAMEGTTIVVTPLIALMKDQVDRLRSMNIPATAIHSGLSLRQIDMAIDNCMYGSTKLLYVAPERLASHGFISRISRIKISLIAVDEAHCISQWGYDFRPSYLQIGQLREHFVGVPILALTASATKYVCNDIMQRLSFREPNMLTGDFARPNLVYAVRSTTNKSEMLLKMLSSVPGSAIIYTRTRKGCEATTELLRAEGIAATFYHGGLPHGERSIRQSEWLTGEMRVMVATNAFGMGIDKPDVRLVVHYVLCDCIESYYQEAGRAGRDGVRSYAAVLVSPRDVERVARSIEMEFPTLEVIKETYDKICASLMVAYGEGVDTSFPFDIREFCLREKIFSGTLFKAIKILQMNGYLNLTEELKLPSQVIFIVSRDDLYRVRINRPELDAIIRLMLRLYDGIFTDYQPIDEVVLARMSGYTIERVKELLSMLWRLRVIKYIPSNKSALLQLWRDRVPKEDLFISPESYKYRRDLYLERFKVMSKYVENNEECRSKMMVEYFGVECSEECGVCDVCVERRRRKRGEEGRNEMAGRLRERIFSTLNGSPCRIGELQSAVKAEANIFSELIENLIFEGRITLSAEGVVSVVSEKKLNRF